MFLPEYVRRCIDTLENAGFPAYAVGGCVRDNLLGLTPHDYDLCTAASPEQMKSVFSDCRLILAGEKHGTVTVIADGIPVQITTFRTEGNYQDSRHPGWVHFVTDIKQDLSRRDFTVNAMAYSPIRGFVDPFEGRKDLEAHCLRAVGDPMLRFTEDPLRILRGVRFSVRYGLKVETETEQAMKALLPEMDHLARERVFDELCSLLPLVSAEDLLRFAPVLAQVIPELAPLLNFDQHSPYHAFDLFTHTALVTQAVPPTLPLRWAALLHDIGKPGTFYRDAEGRGHFPGHAKLGAETADIVLRRMKAPTSLREQVVTLVAQHMTPLEPDKRLLRRRLGKYGISETYELLALQKADFGGKGARETTDLFSQISLMLEEIQAEAACLTVKDLAVNGNDLLTLGFVPGPAVGRCLEDLLALVQEEALENTAEALMKQASLYL